MDAKGFSLECQPLAHGELRSFQISLDMRGCVVCARRYVGGGAGVQ